MLNFLKFEIIFHNFAFHLPLRCTVYFTFFHFPPSIDFSILRREKKHFVLMHTRRLKLHIKGISIIFFGILWHAKGMKRKHISSTESSLSFWHRFVFHANRFIRNRWEICQEMGHHNRKGIKSKRLHRSWDSHRSAQKPFIFNFDLRKCFLKVSLLDSVRYSVKNILSIRGRVISYRKTSLY